MAEARTTIGIASDIHLKVKLACVRRETTLIEAVDEAFTDLLTKWERESRPTKREPARQKMAA